MPAHRIPAWKTRTQLAVMAAALLFVCSGFAAQLLPTRSHPQHVAAIHTAAPIIVPPTTHAPPPPPPPPTTTTTTTRPPIDQAALARFERAIHDARTRTTTTTTTTRARHTSTRRIVVTAPSGGVAQCVKNHESGNYAESSHPSTGSGAYQFIPSTWRSWSARAGYPGYSYAYQAPPSVQDAVFQYAISHGGGGNWSMRYGNDPCTGG